MRAAFSFTVIPLILLTLWVLGADGRMSRTRMHKRVCRAPSGPPQSTTPNDTVPSPPTTTTDPSADPTSANNDTVTHDSPSPPTTTTDPEEAPTSANNDTVKPDAHSSGSPTTSTETTPTSQDPSKPDNTTVGTKQQDDQAPPDPSLDTKKDTNTINTTQDEGKASPSDPSLDTKSTNSTADTADVKDKTDGSLSTTPTNSTASTDTTADPEPSSLSGGTGGCSSAVTLDATTNVWNKYKLHPNKFYRQEVTAAAAKMTNKELASAAAKVASIGTFLWIDTIANIAKIKPAIADVPCNHILGLVIYDLPGRDCAASASNGELKAGEITKYKGSYIDREFTSGYHGANLHVVTGPVC